jgi:hypothetical protein
MLKYNIFNSNHTNSIYRYMNCKRKLLQCNANIIETEVNKQHGGRKDNTIILTNGH